MRYALNDMRELDSLNVFHEGMSQMAEAISSDAAQRANPWEIAIVAHQRAMTPILTDYCAQISQKGSARCALFSDVPEALDWLGVDPDVLDLRLSSGRRIGDPHGRTRGVTTSRAPPGPVGGDHHRRS